MYYIGIDLGTSSEKMVLMDERGKICCSVTGSYPVSFPRPGWSEQNPEDWFETTIRLLKDLTKDIDKSLVKGISFGGQMHGLVILDENNRVIRPAILWNDGRSAEECVYLNEVIGMDRLSEWTANIAFAGFTAPKILWLKKHEPENHAAIRKVMLPKDYVQYRLSGVFATDCSDASGMLLMDVKNRCWSKEMCAICGIEETMLPKLHESYEATGFLKPEIAQELGFGEVRVIAGAGDNAASAIATGAVGNGKCTISLGTSGTIFISSDTFRVDDNNALHAFCDASGRYHLMGCMLSAASCNGWWMDQILVDVNYDRAQEGIEKLGENHVWFLPYLMGERSPINDPYARSVFFGMTMDTSRADMTLAVMEGVAFALRDQMEIVRRLGIDVKRICICGGGAKSRLWRRIIANVLNVEVDVPEDEEGASLGAALLAAVGCGVFKDTKEASAAVLKIKETQMPEADLVEKYNARYETFRKIYPALKDVFERN